MTFTLRYEFDLGHRVIIKSCAWHEIWISNFVWKHVSNSWLLSMRIDHEGRRLHRNMAFWKPRSIFTVKSLQNGLCGVWLRSPTIFQPTVWPLWNRYLGWGTRRESFDTREWENERESNTGVRVRGKRKKRRRGKMRKARRKRKRRRSLETNERRVGREKAEDNKKMKNVIKIVVAEQKEKEQRLQWKEKELRSDEF